MKALPVCPVQPRLREVIAVHVKLEGVIGLYAKGHQIAFFDGYFVGGHSTSADREVDNLLPRLIRGSTGCVGGWDRGHESRVAA
jgi:hypothetical protein